MSLLARGELDLVIGRRGERSVAAAQYHRGALRVLRPMYLDGSGQVTYVVVNPGGAYLDGDRYRLDVTVEDGAQLLLTTQAATKVYRTPRDRAVQDLTVRLGPGARLDYLPDQLIAYRASRYEQETRIDMDPSASLVMAEVVTPGWSPSGAPFGYERLRLRTEVSMGGRPVALDNLILEPAASRNGIASLGLLEGRSHLGSMLVIDPRAGEETVGLARKLLAERAGDLLGGVSALPVPGFALRVLGRSTQAVDGIILAVVNALRAAWHGQGALDLRKY
ncbi:urease accessory protein [Sinomonas atrocyanea]|uniref:urease accessory protein UreD n=1 Tax=Sinomonas atrocyanea TaxID=37927 RepID=UPI0027896294|nr:urease accessory protein UreD [Sinomonas atrocyanea]MDP9884228.1 urease accessory protein [Sinomonas atrocyanea]